MEDFNSEKHHGWALWLSIIAVLIIGVGIFFYYTFLRQSHSELIEAVPTDALFLFEINDNESFVKSTISVTPYLNELFAMDLLPAYQAIYHKLPKQKNYRLTISGHSTNNKQNLLINTHIEKNDFNRILRALRIDPDNYTKFEQYKIYTYGTNYKSLKFVYFNHILTLSDDIELVRKSLIQHTHPKNLLSDNAFKGLYELTNKNTKQNWLILNTDSYLSMLKPLLTDNSNQRICDSQLFSTWAAFQLRFSQKEFFLAGYTPRETQVPTSSHITVADVPTSLLPLETEWYHQKEFADYSYCKFAILADSNIQHEYLILLPDTLRKTLIPFGDSEKTEALRMSYPSGIYPLTDSTFNGSIANTLKPYTCFIERKGSFLCATSEEALSLYSNRLKSHGCLEDNRLYKFSANNTSSSHIETFCYYGTEKNEPSPTLFSQYGQSMATIRHLQIFSANWVPVNNRYTAVNLYLKFQ